MDNMKYKPFRYLLIYLGVLFTSCAQNSTSISSSYTTIFNLLTESFFDDDNRITSEVISAIPYASSLVNFKNSPKSLIILESKQESKYTWISSDEKVFFTQGGRIIGTIGLNNDLFRIERPGNSFKEIISYGKQDPYYTYYSFRKPTLNNLKVLVKTEVIGLQKTKLLENERYLILVEEKLESRVINWNITNKFWVDPKDFVVWKSEQHISPKLPLLYLETTKKPAE